MSTKLVLQDALKEAGVESVDPIEEFKTNRATIELVRSLFDDWIIGLRGERVDSGADYYECPGCHAEHRIQGYSSSSAHITDVKHYEDCKLVKLYNLIKSG